METTNVDLHWSRRAIWGALGGAVAVGSKYIAQDHYWLRVFIDTRVYDRIPGLIVSYLVLLIVLGLLGAVFAVASKENQEMKLLAIAVSAPALITTWLGGTKPPETPTPVTRAAFEWIMPITPAHAADKPVTDSGFWDGFKIPFGIGKDDARYFVVAGPYKNENEASAIATKIMQRKPSLPIFLGDVDSKTGAATLIVGQSLHYDDAKLFRDSVKELPELKEAKDIYLTSKPPTASIGNSR